MEVEYSEAKALYGGNTWDRTLPRKLGQKLAGQWTHFSLGVETNTPRLMPLQLPLHLSSMTHHVGQHFTDSNVYPPHPHLILSNCRRPLEPWSKCLGEEFTPKVGMGPC